MSPQPENPPAFPCPAGHATVRVFDPTRGDHFVRTVEICKTGLSLRDYFAAAAMQGIVLAARANGKEGA